MIITRLALPRRTFLRGVGATLALPLLDAMVPAMTATARTAAAPVKRLGFVYVPNGVIRDRWTPSGSGERLELSPSLAPLAPLRDRVLVLSGLAHRMADGIGDGNGDHSRASTVWLTGAHGKRTEGPDVFAGTSADQHAARVLGQHTPLPSLELALERTERMIGNCDVGYSCVYQNTISWRSPATPIPMEVHPRMVFERLFGESGNAAERAAELARSRSILDSLDEEVAHLQRSLGAGDRRKVDEYLDSVRAVERQIQAAEQHTSRDLDIPDRPIDMPAAFDAHAKLMFDLQVLAYQTDSTRVVSFLMGRELSQRTYPEIGVAEPHHSLSHHRGEGRKIGDVAKINAYHVQTLMYLLEKLNATADGDGTLLDHTIVLYGSGIGDGNLHDHVDLPVIVAGGGGGTLRGGRHLRYSDREPMSNLLLTLLDKAGVPMEKIGDSTRPIDGRAGLTL
jgi:hypothetical protein